MPHSLVDDAMLRDYLAETLPATQMAHVEKLLRDSAELRQRLEDVRQNHPDAAIHSLGAFWRRSRLTCPSREHLGSYLLETLDPHYADYITFHLNTVECPFCRANLDDLRSRAERAAPANHSRQHRYFQSSRHLLSGD